MINDLSKLYNTLCLIDTKGEQTKIMADSLRFIENLINGLKEEQKSENAEGRRRKNEIKETGKNRESEVSGAGSIK